MKPELNQTQAVYPLEDPKPKVCVTTTIVIELLHSCGYFHELSCSFGVGRVMFGIPKRVTSLCLRTLSEILSLFIGGDRSPLAVMCQITGVSACC